MTAFRQVSWLAGHNPSPPSRASLHKAQWQLQEELAAHSCGGSSGLNQRLDCRHSRIPFSYRPTGPAHLNMKKMNERRGLSIHQNRFDGHCDI